MWWMWRIRTGQDRKRVEREFLEVQVLRFVFIATATLQERVLLLFDFRRQPQRLQPPRNPILILVGDQFALLNVGTDSLVV